MSVTIEIAAGGNVVRTLPNIPYAPGMNAQMALEAAYGASGYSFLLQFFGSLGYEVVTIDGVAAQNGSDIGFYWEFIYNGAPATKGIDNTFLNDGDTLMFTYVSYNATQHAGTRLEAIHELRKSGSSGG